MTIICDECAFQRFRIRKNWEYSYLAHRKAKVDSITWTTLLNSQSSVPFIAMMWRFQKDGHLPLIKSPTLFTECCFAPYWSFSSHFKGRPFSFAWIVFEIMDGDIGSSRLAWKITQVITLDIPSLGLQRMRCIRLLCQIYGKLTEELRQNSELSVSKFLTTFESI